VDDGGAVVDGSNRPQAEGVDNDVPLNASGSRASTPSSGTAVLAESVLDRRYRLLAPLTTRGPVTLWRGDDNVLARPVAVRIVEHDPTSRAGEAGADGNTPGPEQAARQLLAAAINSGRLVHPGAASTYSRRKYRTETKRDRAPGGKPDQQQGRTRRQTKEKRHPPRAHNNARETPIEKGRRRRMLHRSHSVRQESWRGRGRDPNEVVLVQRGAESEECL